VKFNVLPIFIDYYKIVRGERINLSSIVDIFFVFVLPALVAICTFWFRPEINENFYLSLFTILGVFIAVMMSIVGVLVPLYHAPRRVSDDKVVDDRYVSEYANRAKLIKEVGTTITYLMLFSTLAMAVLLIPISTKSDLFLFKWISMLVGTHLLINILMIMKRLYALLSFEFR
jgi:hypothetical protein